MLGAEAVGAVLIHASHSTFVTAIFVIVAVVVIVWGMETGVDRFVSNYDWAASLLGTRVGKKLRVHGWWYSTVSQSGSLIGHSVFCIRAGTEGFKMEGHFRKASDGDWSWWNGSGARFGDSEALLYGYDGEEGLRPDNGFGIYEFVDGDTQRVHGNFYGKELADGSNYRSVQGERCPKADVTRDFRRDPPDARKAALERHYELNATTLAV